MRRAWILPPLANNAPSFGINLERDPEGQIVSGFPEHREDVISGGIFQISPQHLSSGTQNASTIRDAITQHPVHHLTAGDLGHAVVAAAVTAFRTGWLTELSLSKKAAAKAKQ